MILRVQSHRKTSAADSGRPGLSLLEVLTALAIFLMSLIALGQLITMSGERAVEVQMQSQASQLSQSKLAEIVSGAVSLSSQSGSFDEDPDWNYEIQAEQDSAITGLWRVQVKVSRDLGDGNTIESTVNQMILDPSLRGSTSDPVPSPTAGNAGGGGMAAGGGAMAGGGATAGRGATAGGGMAAPTAPKAAAPAATPKPATTPAAPPKATAPSPTPGRTSSPPTKGP
jgi:hypothetical protein